MELLPLAPDTPHFRAALDLYEAVHGERPDSAGPRFRDHADHDGYRGVVALDDGGRVVGLAYGHDSKLGGEYHERLRGALPDALAAEWLRDAFELVELAVADGARRCGLGTRLTDAVLDGVKRGTAVLTTERDNDGAKAFYEATGWSPVHEPFVVAGVEMTVFGRALR
ncbi:GNAT family N-acetyltransferase [Halosegnis marinus]|uniref:GNAT family N-acetyltransferase n=1 Tax=Halosegnis marinus TaxID=3034023 RepID=A0ABD5ZL38_9EURY|nr:GNAT family N-acetyltransferase [Halosegnis sp. DT85]